MHFIYRSRVFSSVVSSCWQSRSPQGQVQRSSSAGSHCCNPVRLSRHWQVTSLFHLPLFHCRVVFCSAAWRLNSCELHLVLLSLRTLFLLLGGPARRPFLLLTAGGGDFSPQTVWAVIISTCLLETAVLVLLLMTFLAWVLQYRTRRDRCGTRKVLSLTLRFRAFAGVCITFLLDSPLFLILN